MSSGAYAADKCLAHPKNLNALREGSFAYPVHLHLIPSDLCNLACPGCAYRAEGFRSTELYRGPNGEKNPKRFLPWHVLQRVLEDCAEMGTRGIEITGGGEPTLHPQINELFDVAFGLNLHTALITNGLMLHRQNLLYHAAKCDWTRISIDACTAPCYDVVRPSLGSGGVPTATDNYGRVMLNLSRLDAMRGELASQCVIGSGFVVQRANYTEMYGAAREARNAGADNIRISGLFSPAGEAYFADWRDEAEELERHTVRDFHSPRFQVHARFHEKIEDLAGPPTQTRCGYMGFTLYLGADANLYTCCNNAYTRKGLLGNVIEAGGLKKLLDKPETRRRIHDLNPAKECSQCQFRDRLAAIEAAVAAPEAPALLGIIHPWFV